MQMSEENNEVLENEETKQEQEEKKQKESKKTDLEIALAELDEAKDRFKRIAAEFDNYKKRTAKEKDMLYNTLVSDIIVMFLPVIDNMEKAVESETRWCRL